MYILPIISIRTTDGVADMITRHTPHNYKASRSGAVSMMSVALKTESATSKEYYSSTWNSSPHQTKLTGNSRESFDRRCTPSHPPDETPTTNQVTRLEFQDTYLGRAPLNAPSALEAPDPWLRMAFPMGNSSNGSPSFGPCSVGPLRASRFVGLLAVSYYCAPNM